MNRKTLFCLLCLCAFRGCFAQADTLKLQADWRNKMYLDMVASPYKYGLAVCGNDGSPKGYIDSLGNLKIPQIYTSADTFSQGFAGVSKNWENFGYIDTLGKAITPFKYKWAKAFEHGYGQVAISNDTIAFVDKNGKQSAPIYIGMGAYFQCSRAAMYQNSKKGYIDYSGTFVIPPIYDEGEHFNNGMASVKKEGKWGVIDTLGKVILPCEYDYFALNTAKDGLCVFGKNKKKGLLRLDGTVVVSPKYEKIYTFWDNGLWIYTQNGLDGLMKSDGTVLSQPIYDGWGPGFIYGFQSVSKNRLWGVIDKQGKTIAPCRYTQLIAFYHFDDATQKVVTAERALAQIGNKIGIIDTTGKEIIPIIYDAVTPLNANTNHSPINCDVDFYAVVQNKQIGVMDKNGKLVLPITYEAVSLGCKDILHIYKKRDELCGYATTSGKILLAPSLKSVGCKYEERKAITYKTEWGCEGVRGHPCDPLPLPCYQCEIECPDVEWLKAHGY